ncbi:Signal peptidase complex catalytic subunit [Naganishia adeliensis]|uniref:Signal peptidase complex catalytic subunit n=1 Tax=Naganishia adeliensis TaxID=92952 RepID=A0ACC2X2H3_9TREE|nr:Signal peptidase complex catalytic subunit [Naganishia adeliensis]
MEPAFYRGDILFLTNPVNEQYVVGDITVYQVPGTEIPIVHRVIETRTSSNASQLLLTKGDNNHADDIALYAKGMQWVEREHVVGKVRGFLPYVGYLTIALNDFPQLKYALLGGLGLLMLVQRE